MATNVQVGLCWRCSRFIDDHSMPKCKQCDEGKKHEMNDDCYWVCPK